MKTFSTLLFFLLLASLTSCAFTNPLNTPLVTAVDETLGGEDKDSWATIAAIPLALPLGLIDVVVVHPAQVIDDAANDTWDLLWEQSVKGSAMRSFVALPRLALTPVVFCGDWLGRSLFDIPPHGAKTVASTKPMTEQEREQTMKRIAQLEKDIIRLRERLDSH